MGIVFPIYIYYFGAKNPIANPRVATPVIDNETIVVVGNESCLIPTQTPNPNDNANKARRRNDAIPLELLNARPPINNISAPTPIEM